MRDVSFVCRHRGRGYVRYPVPMTIVGFSDYWFTLSRDIQSSYNPRIHSSSHARYTLSKTCQIASFWVVTNTNRRWFSEILSMDGSFRFIMSSIVRQSEWVFPTRAILYGIGIFYELWCGSIGRIFLILVLLCFRELFFFDELWRPEIHCENIVHLSGVFDFRFLGPFLHDLEE